MMTLGCPPMMISLEMKVMKKEAILEMRVTKVQSHQENEGDLTKCVFNSVTMRCCNENCVIRTVLTVCCHCRGHLREGLKGSEPSGSGRHEGEGFNQKCEDSFNQKLNCLFFFFFLGAKSCWTTNSMNIMGPLWVDMLNLQHMMSRISVMIVFHDNVTDLTLIVNFMIKTKCFILLCLLSGCNDAVWAGMDVN